MHCELSNAPWTRDATEFSTGHHTSRETKRIPITSFIPVAKPETTILHGRYTKMPKDLIIYTQKFSPNSSHMAQLIGYMPLSWSQMLWTLILLKSHQTQPTSHPSPNATQPHSRAQESELSNPQTSMCFPWRHKTLLQAQYVNFSLWKKLDCFPDYIHLCAWPQDSIVLQRAASSECCRKYIHEEAWIRAIPWDPAMK